MGARWGRSRCRVTPDIENLADLLVRVDGAPAPWFLARPVIAEGDYGMLSAEFKAGKTWLATDAAVSVASGTSWPASSSWRGRPGTPVRRGGVAPARSRRFRAVCESRGIDAATLPVRVCLRSASDLDKLAMTFVADEIAQHRPALVIIDPLYLAARGPVASTSTRWARTSSASSWPARTMAQRSSSPITGTRPVRARARSAC